MTTYTWTGTGGSAWTTTLSWSPNGTPGTLPTDIANVTSGFTDINGTAETIASLNIGTTGIVGVDHTTGDQNGSLTVSGAVTNKGGPFGTGGFLIGNASHNTTAVKIGSLNNSTTTSLTDINNASVQVTGNVTNAGRGTSGSAGISVGYRTGETEATLSVAGSLTNSGALGL
ncbi:MAG TPA: hypothetical protein VGG12_00420, partial [Methylovirgula sp.]